MWAAAAFSASLLELPFPLAGPLPAWRLVFAWCGLVPLLWALLSPATVEAPRPLRRSFLLAYLCGVLWYAGNCYWVRNTMMRYGDMPPLAPSLLLAGFSLVLGLYFGLFGLGVALVRRAAGSARLALALAPVFWVAQELAAARITSVPWDQLGYSQVDNALLNQLAPWTGVYGISFVLVAVNALLAGALTLDCHPHVLCRERKLWGLAGAVLLVGGTAGIFLKPPRPAATATAVLIQPNLDVGSDNFWTGPEWNRQIARFQRLAAADCGFGLIPGSALPSFGKSYIAGIPQTGAPIRTTECPPQPAHPDLVAWPESPAPFVQGDARFEQALETIARREQAPLVVGGLGTDYSFSERRWRYYNSALIVGPDGLLLGRYDKIHLVPFGEYVPFQRFLFFARKLTGQVSAFSRGSERRVFLLGTRNGPDRRYGVFICYEAVFADEVRQFSRRGAQVLVNLSDDGWYGDTSAPWQHLNMVRMRAIENRRWILRDTNNGVTAAIDPYGRVRQSLPRHRVDALVAHYGFCDKVTFYAAHGDLFAWLCALLAAGWTGWAGERLLRRPAAVPAGKRKT
ncbi:MAG: apolipoprotein N-acyltransferase [Terracidiphilus sp.]